jgi:cytochrome P450
VLVQCRPGLVFDLACDESYQQGNRKDIDSEAVETILGGSEAIAHVLLHCTAMLVKHPHCLGRLRKDLVTHGVNPMLCSHNILLEVPYLVIPMSTASMSQN